MLLLGRTSVNLNVLPAADLGPTEPESYHNPWYTARWSSALRGSSRCCAEPSKQRRNQHPPKGVELGEPRAMVRRVVAQEQRPVKEALERLEARAIVPNPAGSGPVTLMRDRRRQRRLW